MYNTTNVKNMNNVLFSVVVRALDYKSKQSGFESP